MGNAVSSFRGCVLIHRPTRWHKLGASKGSRTLIPTLEASDNAVIPYSHGADDGNRTHVSGLGSPHSAIEPHSQIGAPCRNRTDFSTLEGSYTTNMSMVQSKNKSARMKLTMATCTDYFAFCYLFQDTLFRPSV